MDLDHSRNVLIRRMPLDVRKRLAPHFEEEELAFKQTLLEQGKLIKYIYFVESGVVSMVTDLTDGETIETGTVGNEGLVGLPAVLGIRRASGRALCQVPGRALRIAVEMIDAEAAQASPWFRVLLRYANFVAAMAAQTAACNRAHPVEARMSRWLLMMHDRVDSDDFALTQQFLSMMLGVARPTVNIAGATLQKAGFIRYARGRITILDRRGLESASCECYGRVREELELMLGDPPQPRMKAMRMR